MDAEMSETTTSVSYSKIISKASERYGMNGTPRNMFKDLRKFATWSGMGVKSAMVS